MNDKKRDPRQAPGPMMPGGREAASPEQIRQAIQTAMRAAMLMQQGKQEPDNRPTSATPVGMGRQISTADPARGSTLSLAQALQQAQSGAAPQDPNGTPSPVGEWSRPKEDQGAGLAQALGGAPRVGEAEISEALATLKEYQDGKSALDRRIIDNEEWYKLAHWKQQQNPMMQGKRAPASGWLFNSIANKHADAMDNYPEPNVLPRARDDEETAKALSAILPVVLEQCDYEQVYSDTWWRKLKQGTGVKGIFWDPVLRDGLGDISIKSMDLRMLYWEPGVNDIQDSANLFSLAVVDTDRLRSRWPQLQQAAGGTDIVVPQYTSDRTIDTSKKSVVVDWYYKRENPAGQTVLHYCKFCNGVVLYASENDPALAERGFYDHGKYPFVFDPLFVEENSPAGFGYIDVMKDTQDSIDRLTQAMDENTRAAAKKRYLISDTAGINEEELLDFGRDVVHLAGRLDEQGFKELETSPVPGNVLNYWQARVDELKEVSGNRDVSQGGTTSGLTAASAIAALQEAGSKLSRDMLKSAYRAFAKECYMVIELMRQFYDEARVYRIKGKDGAAQYMDFSGAALRARPGGMVGGVELGDHEPVFDITVSAAKKSTFSRLSQNETAKECYQLGFFAPGNADAALACLDMMDFDGIEKVRERVAQNGTLYQQLQQAMGMIQQLNAVLEMRTGAGVGGAADAAAQAAKEAGGGGGGNAQAPTVTNSLGGAVGGGTAHQATAAARRAMNVANPNR